MMAFHRVVTYVGYTFCKHTYVARSSDHLLWTSIWDPLTTDYLQLAMVRDHYPTTTFCSSQIHVAPVNQDYQTEITAAVIIIILKGQNRNAFCMILRTHTCGKQTGIPPLIAFGGLQIACKEEKGRILGYGWFHQYAQFIDNSHNMLS